MLSPGWTWRRHELPVLDEVDDFAEEIEARMGTGVEALEDEEGSELESSTEKQGEHWT